MKEVVASGESIEKIQKDLAQKKPVSGRLGHVRTYRQDVAELITKKKVTRTHVAIAEEERRRAIGESSVWEGEKPASMFPLFFAGIFLLVGLSILFYNIAGKNIPLFIDRTPPQIFLIPNGTTHSLGLSRYTRDELTRGIRDISRKEKLPQGAHLRISYRAHSGTSSLALPLKNFFLTLEGNIPDTLTRSIAPLYEGGLISAGETKGYLVFTTTYYENAVVGLLAWEKQMVRDLYPVIDPLRAELVPTPAVGTWRAELWQGNDLRVFTTTEGRVALVYGWVDKKTLIITGNVQVFTELVRLLKEPVKK
jgi:hypothetical protein